MLRLWHSVSGRFARTDLRQVDPAAPARPAWAIVRLLLAAATAAFIAKEVHDLQLAARFNQSMHLSSETLGEAAIDLFLLCLIVMQLLYFRTRLHKQTLRQFRDSRIRAERNAATDMLTDLANRSSFSQAVDSALGSAAWEQRNLLLLADIDKFSQINDLFGHGVGDAVLVEYGQRLRAAFPEAIAIGRLAGNQFAVLAYADGDDEAFAARLPINTANRLEHDGQTITLPGLWVAIGMANSAKCLSASFSLLQAAEFAVTAAKGAGGHCTQAFHGELKRQLQEETRILSELPNAIATHEIIPYFQPLVGLEHGDLRGFEVLARWLHPKYGIIPPVKFIPLIRDAQMLTAMTEQLISLACEEARFWPKRLVLAFNFNAEQLAQPSRARLRTPIIAISETDNWQAKVASLDAGADDYVVKPCQTEEIVARLNALFRRSSGNTTPRLVVGQLAVDPAARNATLSGAALSLTDLEYRLLHLFVRNPNTTLSHDAIREYLYPHDPTRHDNTIAVHVGRLRKKIGRDLILSIRELGYRMPR